MSNDYFSIHRPKAHIKVGGLKNHITNFDSDYEINQINLLDQKKQKRMGKIPTEITRQSRSNDIQGFINNMKLGKNDNIDKYHEYDPYYGYLQEHGLLKENYTTRINNSYININSSARITTPQLITETEYNLSNNPLSFATTTLLHGISTSTVTTLRISYPNHSFSKGDKITLNGVSTSEISINTVYENSSNETKYSVLFTNNSMSIAFVCNYDGTNTISTMSFDPYFKIGTGINYTDLKNYDTSNMTVTITGFETDDGTSFIGNIPVNFLNSTHRIYFSNPDYTIINGIKVFSSDTLINVPSNDVVSKITGFYILLDTQFLGDQLTENMKITLRFNYIGGISLNRLNAGFPINDNNSTGYHQIYSITSDTLDVLLTKTAYYQDTSFGGTTIYISKIINLISGYSTPSEYKIELPYCIENVITAKMISSTFPNTSTIFRNTSEFQNTYLYWQNREDGTALYNISISPGNYSIISLIQEIETKVYAVEKIISQLTGSLYNNKNVIKVSINESTNLVTFKSYKEAIVDKPIHITDPVITDTSIQTTSTFILTILHAQHGFNSDSDIVLFDNFIQTFGIPASILNGIHNINTIIDDSTYTIKVINVNLDSDRTNTGGGFSTKIYFPNKFRLLFNTLNTMGNELGFRKVGEDTSITSFNTVITNADSYQNELVTIEDGYSYVNDESGNLILLKNNVFNFNGFTNLIMVIRELQNGKNISHAKNIGDFFAKINFETLKYNIDTYINTPKLLYNPINISELTVSFYSPDGYIYDFNGLEHSYIIEFTHISYVPEENAII